MAIGRIHGFAREHRTLMLFAGALVSGAVALYAGQRYLSARLEQERGRQVVAPQAMIDVVVASRDLQRGETLTADVLSARSVPRAWVSSDAVSVDRFESLVGGRLRSGVRSGEAVLASLVLGADATTFSQKLRAGVRALTLPVDEVNAIAGMLQPGDRIDLYYSAVMPGATSGAQAEATLPMFQNLLVLATGQQSHSRIADDDGERRGFSHVTVEVTPDQAQRIIVARQSGRLTASLRHPDDAAALAAKSMDARQLLGLVEPVPVRRAPGLQIIVGGLGNGAVARFEGSQAVFMPRAGVSQTPVAAAATATAMPAIASAEPVTARSAAPSPVQGTAPVQATALVQGMAPGQSTSPTRSTPPADAAVAANATTSATTVLPAAVAPPVLQAITGSPSGLPQQIQTQTQTQSPR